MSFTMESNPPPIPRSKAGHDRVYPSMTYSASQLIRICLGIVLLLPAGCLVGPKYRPPVATPTDPPPGTYKESPVHFKEDKTWKVARPGDAIQRGDWWKIFKDPELNALEEDLNINNQNIKQFFQNYMEARALVGEINSQLYPTVTANGSFTKSRTGPAPVAGAALAALDVSWEPDLWGKVRNAVRAARYNAQLSAADLENEKLSEQASLAVFYFQIRGQDALQQLFNETIVADRKALDYTKAQYETGMTDQIAVVEATNTLQNAQATATNIGVARAQFEHAIAVLVGKVASNFSIPVVPLKATAPPIPLGLPSQLLERRPDVAAAERAMAAANAQIGMADAAYYPAFTLGAERGFQHVTVRSPSSSSNSTTTTSGSKSSAATTTTTTSSSSSNSGGSPFEHLFDVHNTIWSVGPSVSEPIFDAGLRSFTVHQYVATYNAALASYRQTSLTAFQQVEDFLAQVRILSTQYVQQRAAEDSAKTFVKLAFTRYQTGIDPYVNVVTAQTTLLVDQHAVINVQVQEMTGAVQLIKALGGGWDGSQLPTPSQVAKWPSRAETRIQQ